jgi:peptidoglycan/xylan/chitin deacetylase (PgdA/CDA1 family)
MCQTCRYPGIAAQMTRRVFGAFTLAGLASAATPGSASASNLVEPELHLPVVSSDQHTVALTLDACPGHFDERIARVLVDERIPATIFVTALWIAHNPAGLSLLLAHRDLFSLQNHGARHIPPILGEHTIYGLQPAGTLDVVRREVADGAAAVTAATGIPPRWYRGATGLYSPEAVALIEHMGFAIGGYSLNSDFGASLPAAVVASRIANAPPRSVIIGHVNQPMHASGAGIAEGVQMLRQRGTNFVRLDDPALHPVA